MKSRVRCLTLGLAAGAAVVLFASPVRAEDCAISCSANCQQTISQWKNAIAQHDSLCGGSAPGAGHGTSCVVELATVKNYLSVTELQTACAGSQGACVPDLARLKNYLSVSDLNTACRGGPAECAPELAKIKNYLSVADLGATCMGTRGSCVPELAQLKPYLSVSDLHLACKPSR